MGVDDPDYTYDQPVNPNAPAQVAGTPGSVTDPSFSYDEPIVPQQPAPTGGGAVSDPDYQFDQPVIPSLGNTGGTAGGAVSFDPSFGFDQPVIPQQTGTVTTVTLAITIQGFIDLGNAFTGKFIGTPFGHYRPTNTGAALSPTNLLTILPCSFVQKGNFKTTPDPKLDLYTGYFDGSVTRAGDYLTNGTRTYFIAAQQPLLPYLCVECPRVVSFARPAAVTSAGVSTYGGTTQATQTTLATGWPASILQGTKGERGDVSTPDDVKSPWFALRVAQIPGVQIMSGDLVQDDLGRTYSVSSSELTEFGWRLTMRQNLN